MKQTILRAIFLAVTALSCSAAGITAGDYSGSGTLANFGAATGFYFTPTENITVLQLGFYDFTGLGFADAHNVGIFEANGTLIINASISAGTVNPLIAGTVGGTRVVDVAPTLLTSGTQYYINGDNFSSDRYGYGAGAVTFASQITWDGFSVSAANDIFSPTANGGGQPGDLGANFIFQSASVPEPGSLLLCASGLAALFIRRYRKA